MGLDSSSVEERLASVRALGTSVKAGVALTDEVNNHVHSTYSFSPYSPSHIAVKAAQAGLRTVGIMDHDSVSGCAEFLEACKAVGIASTAGFEMRVNMDGTSMEGRKTNNPDEPNISYIALHGIPATQFAAVRRFLAPVFTARLARDRREVARLNEVLALRGGPALDFEREVLPLSEAADGGSVTERHILCALARKLIETHGKGAALVSFVEGALRTPVTGRLREWLLDEANPHYVYDLLGAFKAALVPEFFLPSGNEECLSVREAVAFANRIGAIPAYAYLGDVGDSLTGDKKTEKFEDDFLDDLVPELAKIGFKAITYMPPRNTRAQLRRLQRLCQAHGLMEISGVDINSSRQTFNCPILLEPEFVHLTEAAWALVAHEKLAAADPALALFSPDNPLAAEPLAARIAAYADLGRKTDPARPETALSLFRSRRG